eukprot:TRINITY_DN13225_c0_g1_i1.p1 TRINITY_DN13225_c0_g1~~TRINITY_DN13225_c0_g1_i1.p1  ORF type:complete len:652 (-),score=116.19 TRINITY_DN13225_c0_g1_i1:483-2438(-)
MSAMEVDEVLGTADVFDTLTVRDILENGEIGCKVLLKDGLGDVASCLAASGGTAAVVADDQNCLAALITENDLMRAYWENVAPTVNVQSWLSSGEARAPGDKLKRMTVLPSATLTEVSELMVANAASGDGSCHHVVVQEQGGQIYGVLSAHDFVGAIAWRPSEATSQAELLSIKPQTLANLKVEEVMKGRDSILTCPPYNTMKDILRVLLVTEQNSALIVDGNGIHGIVTARDVIRAFTDSVPNTCVVADWLREKIPNMKDRVVSPDAPLSTAAEQMMRMDLNHLVVVRPASKEAIGTLSALDIVFSSTVHEHLSEWHARLRGHTSAGPPVSELIKQPWHRNSVCNLGTTLRQAAQMLLKEQGTSVSLPTLSWNEGSWLTLVTEYDVITAFIKGVPHDSLVEDWLLSHHDSGAAIPAYVQVPPCASLADAASLMITAGAQAGRPRHHLVVKGPTTNFEGVVSALDVARGLTSMCGPLDLAKMGADETAVSVIMKPMSAVPTCRLDDTLQHAMMKLVLTGQTAAAVVDDAGVPCLDGVITPRCAMQAVADGLSHNTTLAKWMETHRGTEALREVKPDMKLFDAALLMVRHRLHHLVVAERPYCTKPLGVVSSLDIVRGIASISLHTPFLTLDWLRQSRGTGTCELRMSSPAQ